MTLAFPTRRSSVLEPIVRRLRVEDFLPCNVGEWRFDRPVIALARLGSDQIARRRSRQLRDTFLDDLRFLRRVRRLFLDDVALLFGRSEEHTSELQSLMRISYAVFCLKNKNQ